MLSHREHQRSFEPGLIESVPATAAPLPSSAYLAGFQYAPLTVGYELIGPQPPDTPLPATRPVPAANDSCVHLPPPDSGFSSVANASTTGRLPSFALVSLCAGTPALNCRTRVMLPAPSIPTYPLEKVASVA